VQISPGLGRTDVTIPLASVSLDKRSELFGPIEAVATSVTMHDSPPAWKQGRDVWGETPETLDLMQSLKSEFDPNRVLNPGRFAGSI
jgi:glycolate oxidase FAD binding subunit